MDGSVEGDLSRCGCPGADIVYCRDVAAGETYPGAELEHGFVAWIKWG